MTKPEIRWRIIRGPWFDNMLSALEYGGRQARFSLKRTAPDAAPAPRLSLSAKPNSAELGAEPFDPLAGWVSAGQQAPAIGAAAEGSRAEHGEDAVLLVVADQRCGQRKALHAFVPGGPERDKGI